MICRCSDGIGQHLSKITTTDRPGTRWLRDKPLHTTTNHPPRFPYCTYRQYMAWHCPPNASHKLICERYFATSRIPHTTTQKILKNHPHPRLRAMNREGSSSEGVCGDWGGNLGMKLGVSEDSTDKEAPLPIHSEGSRSGKGAGGRRGDHGGLLSSGDGGSSGAGGRIFCSSSPQTEARHGHSGYTPEQFHPTETRQSYSTYRCP